MTRWKAATIHLLVGLLVLGTICGLIFHFWYPYALYRIAGLDQLLVTMLCVDLVAGPLLTCIVYKVNDKRTKWDLTVIGLLQAGFLGYALHTAWITRPVFLVWAIDHFALVFANEVAPRNLAQARDPALRTLPWKGPRLVAVSLPRDSRQKEVIFTELIASQTSVENLPKHYGPYRSQRTQVLRQSRTVETAASGNPGARWREVISETDLSEAQLRVVGIESTRDVSMLLLDGTTADPLRTLSIDPNTSTDQDR